MLGQNLKVDPEHKKMRDKFKRLLFLVVFLVDPVKKFL